MLTSILPGLRDVRTPLACGYMWLVAAWLAFADHLPRTRPSAGMAASVWDLGGHVGKVAVLAGVTFAAYLIGAVLEFDPTRLWRSMGVPSEASLLQSFEVGGLQVKMRELTDQIQEVQAGAASNTARADDVTQEGEESSTKDDLERRMEDTRREARLVERAVELRDTMSGSSGVEIMQALATKLQALSTELFGRYDRLQAEASLRLNIALPLATLLELVIWRSPFLFWIKLSLSLVAVALAAILLRQSLLRVRSANQVLIMAERVGIFDETTSITNLPSKMSS